MAAINDGPGRLDWSVTKGQTWSRAFTVAQGGAPWSLVGATVTAVVKTAEDSTGTTFTTLTATLTDAAGGIFTLSKAANATAALAAGRYWWSCHVHIAGVQTPLMYGTFVINDLVEP